MRVAVINAPTARIRKAGFPIVTGTSYDFDELTDEWVIDGTERVRALIAGFPVAGPNFFLLPRGNFLLERYAVRWLRMIGRQDARRIEQRPHARISPWRKPNPRDYIIEPHVDEEDETHRGPAALTANGAAIDVEVHLMDQFQPIDGSYRWYGRISAHPAVAELLSSGRRDVTVRVPGGPETPGRLTELDPWGNVRITGTGPPPY